jgi:hypothetical protein
VIGGEHYQGRAALDAIKAALTPEEYRGFLRGNVMKYLWRLGKKGPALGDAQKAQEYLGWLIEELEVGQ